MRRQNVWIFLLFVLLTAGMTYPLILRFSTAINDVGDPLFNTWILAWNHHQLLRDPLHYFDANIFYPHRFTLAYSEHLFASALLALPVKLFGAGPITVYNFVLFSSFVLCGFGMFLLVRELTGRPAAGILAGMAFAFSAHRFSQLPHLQILTAQWMPFALLYLHRAFQHPAAWKNFLLFALFFLLQALSCNYLAVIFTVAVGVWLAGMILSRGKSLGWGGLGKLSASLAVAGAFFLPFAYPYYAVQKEYGFSRSLQDVKPYSAKPHNYLGVTGKHKFFPQKLKEMGNKERDLFFGFTAMFLALLAFLFRQKKRALPRAVYLVMLLFCFLLSMGTKSEIFGISLYGQPYRFFYDWVPGFDGMRVPARFAVVVGLALAVLAGLGAAGLLERLRRPAAALTFTGLLAAAILADGWCVPLRHRVFDAEPPTVTAWLRDQPDIRALLHLPMHKSEAAYREMNYVYWSMFHWKKMVNGYSGFFPPDYESLKERMLQFPSKETLDELKHLGVNYVVFHPNQYPAQGWEEILRRLDRYTSDLELVKELDSARVYRIREEKK